MYERMLDRQNRPDLTAMHLHCRQTATLFAALDEWLSSAFATERSMSFPYGNHYGWCITHRKKGRLLCHLFPESGAFTVMVRLSGSQCARIYPQLHMNGQYNLDKKYPCGDGGWIHYRICSPHDLEDIQMILTAKCERSRSS
ncbi:MAG: DUF3788 family protein [Butyricicoccaceae bacterium]